MKASEHGFSLRQRPQLVSATLALILLAGPLSAQQPPPQPAQQPPSQPASQAARRPGSLAAQPAPARATAEAAPPGATDSEPADGPQFTSLDELLEAVEQRDANRQATAGMPLQTLLDQVAESTGREFLVDARVPERISVRGTDIGTIDYPLLLSILRGNGLAAIEIDGRVNVVDVNDVRQLPSRIVSGEETDVPGDEIVTMVVRLSQPSLLVPVLRPMMPIYAHLAATGRDGGGLIIVDRFANARRVAEIARALDR